MGTKKTVLTPIPYKKPFVHISDTELYVDMSYYSLTKKGYVRKKVRFKEKWLSRQQKIDMLPELCREIERETERRNSQGIYHEQVVKPGAVESVTRTLQQWLLLASEDVELSADRRETFIQFNGNLDTFCAEHTLYADISPFDIDEHMVKAFVVYLKNLGRAGKTINKYLLSLQQLTEWLVDKKVLATKFSTEKYRVVQKKNETGRFPPLSNDELKRAFEYFHEWKGGHFYGFFMMVHYQCFRPVEIHRLQRKHFDFEGKMIFIQWEDAKNYESNWVQMLDPVHEWMVSRGIDKLDGDMFVFGDHCQPSAIEYLTANYSSDVWRWNRDKMNMPKEKQLYGAKHTFVRNFINAAIQAGKKPNWEWLRRHCRHATVEQTKDYASEIMPYFVIEKDLQIQYVHAMPVETLATV